MEIIDQARVPMKEDLNPQGAVLERQDARLWQIQSECMLCGHRVFRNVVVAPDRHYGNPGTFPIVECESCQLWFLNPMPTIEFLSGAYPSNYYSYAAQPANRKYRPIVKKIKRLIRRLIGYTSGWSGDPKFPQPGRILDVGCGSGTFLMQMRELGWDAHGVELSSEASEHGRQEGLEIFGGTLESANYPNQWFDYVRSNHSFEHIHNPREVLREIHRIIKPDGRLFIGVPNVNGLMSRLYGTFWWHLGAPVHTFGYSPITLSKLLAQEGFQVTRVQFNSTFAGIFGSLQIILNRKNGRASEDGWVVNNPGLRLLGHWMARCMDLFHAGDCIEIIAEPLFPNREV